MEKNYDNKYNDEEEDDDDDEDDDSENGDVKEKINK